MSTIARQGRGFRAGYAFLYLAFLYIPVLFLPLFSFNSGIYVAFPIQGWTLKWYGTLLVNDRLHEALGNSLEVAVAAALISTTLAIFAAKAFTRYRYRGQRLSLGVVMLPMVMPDIIVGVSLLILLNQVGIGLGLHSVIIGHTMICLPFAVAVLMSRMEGFDRNLEEASLDLGEGPVATFFRVTLPLILPGVVASLLLTFTISFDEFIIAFFLSATDTTLPVFIWSQLRFPQRLPTVLALGACILVFSACLVVFSEWFRRRGQVSAGPGVWS
ncbi:spermidine/putrescine transport system permease protein [Tistlia consotensis]|uniref:Spermidine/putrescine transport system permease protein n=1 Tax=Tistlia consotensis USBA 355 TaxID=560819 RepID=A0A1Y6BK57_9PROT|nr:ABC transporter permease [Tistlia consotensis]SMF13748.1 spermidine/putrescine transport system permease protein [Tistlia consotensis USBA 355]SNR50237.1 spermidine/putrescine transport system permease protein [Tistlia consotensis]